MTKKLNLPTLVCLMETSDLTNECLQFARGWNVKYYLLSKVVELRVGAAPVAAYDPAVRVWLAYAPVAGEPGALEGRHPRDASKHARKRFSRCMDCIGRQYTTTADAEYYLRFVHAGYLAAVRVRLS